MRESHGRLLTSRRLPQQQGRLHLHLLLWLHRCFHNSTSLLFPIHAAEQSVKASSMQMLCGMRAAVCTLTDCSPHRGFR